MSQVYLHVIYNARSCFSKFQLRKLYILQVVSAGVRNLKVMFQQVSVAETIHTHKFLNRFRMLKLFVIAKLQQVPVDGNVWNLGNPRISHCGNSIVSAEFQKCWKDIFFYLVYFCVIRNRRLFFLFISIDIGCLRQYFVWNILNQGMWKVWVRADTSMSQLYDTILIQSENIQK